MAAVNAEPKTFPSEEVFTKVCELLMDAVCCALDLPSTSEDQKTYIQFLSNILDKYYMHRSEFLEQEFKTNEIRAFIKDKVMFMGMFDIHFKLYEEKYDPYPLALLNVGAIDFVKRWANDEFGSEQESSYAKLVSDELISMIEQRREIVRDECMQWR